MERFVLQKSEKPNHYVCTDTEHLIVCVWEAHKFNDTQNVTMLEDFPVSEMGNVARYMREMGDWLRENHYDKIF